MRYYKLDENGWPLASYARPQPDKDLLHLPDQPSDHHRWDGEQWIEDILPSEWLARIATERERRLDTSISVALSDGTYTIPVTDRAAALAPNAEKRARKHGKKVPFPTDKGIIDFDAADFSTIEDALGDYMEGVFHRERDLQGMVSRGAITEADLESGWPRHA